MVIMELRKTWNRMEWNGLDWNGMELFSIVRKVNNN